MLPKMHFKSLNCANFMIVSCLHGTRLLPYKIYHLGHKRFRSWSSWVNTAHSLLCPLFP